MSTITEAQCSAIIKAVQSRLGGLKGDSNTERWNETLADVHARIRDALAATGTPQTAKTFEQWAKEKGLAPTLHGGIQSINTMYAVAEHAWYSALASQGAAPDEARVYSDHTTLVAGQPLHVQAVIDAAWRRDPAALTESLTAAAFAEMKQRAGAAPTGAGDAAMGNMTAERAAFFLHRFKLEEKMLGPNEQAALEFAIAALAAPQQPAEAAPGEIDALRANDARYRWLRDKSEPGICAFYLSVGMALHGVKFKAETVDEAIDAALANNKKGGEHAAI